MRFELSRTASSHGLELTKLRGAIEIDPAGKDFFKVTIEERKGTSSRTDLSEIEKARLDKALKVLANAASYGIYAEMNPQETDEKTTVTCHGIDPKPFTCRVAHPDVPWGILLPPMASLITGAARLMLSLLEYSVTQLGGTYAMEDTDSMAIVVDEEGRLVACPGGSHQTKGWEQVRSRRFPGNKLSKSHSSLIASTLIDAMRYLDLYSKSKRTTSIRKPANSASSIALRSRQKGTFFYSRQSRTSDPATQGCEQ